MICPDCKGAKMLSANLGGPPDMPAVAWFTCGRCAGQGVVTPELDRWWEAGRLHRERRIARKESLRDCAARYSLPLATVCDLENGRFDLETLIPTSPKIRGEGGHA